MANQTSSTRRPASAKTSGKGLKTLIMAASVAMTIGGWGILAAGQTQDASAGAAQSQAFVQSASASQPTTSQTTNSSTVQSQAAAPVTLPRAIARTRSSR